MLLRVLPLLTALLLLGAPSQASAALVSAAPTSLPPATSEIACTAFFAGGSESQIGLLCHNDPVNKSDPTGLSIVGKIIKIIVIGSKKGEKVLHDLTSMKSAVRAQKEGEEIVMRSEKLAREVAKAGGDGATPIKEVDKATGRSHYHDANREGGHVFYEIAGALTIAGSLPPESGAFERGGAAVLDLFNPLSLPQDVLDVYDAIRQPVR
jgi:hypothetical protein